MQPALEKVRKTELKSLTQAAEAVALEFAKSTCLQISTLALIIAKRIGRAQTEATITLGEAGFNRLIQEIKTWVGELPSTYVDKLYQAPIWPHRFKSVREELAQVTLDIQVPGTPPGGEPQTWALYKILCELGQILSAHGFDTNDIGKSYDPEKLPHLGILLRFPWSSDMKALFCAYTEDWETIERLQMEIARENVNIVREIEIVQKVDTARERATSMWDAL